MCVCVLDRCTERYMIRYIAVLLGDISVLIPANSHDSNLLKRTGPSNCFPQTKLGL